MKKRTFCPGQEHLPGVHFIMPNKRRSIEDQTRERVRALYDEERRVNAEIGAALLGGRSADVLKLREERRAIRDGIEDAHLAGRALMDGTHDGEAIPAIPAAGG